jgi:uncharacterized protein with PQ loop repeat
MAFWNIIGCIAATCGAISLVPEVYKALKTHHLRDISWGMLALLWSSSVLWGAYGFSQNDVPLVFSSVMNVILESTLLILKKHYELTGKPLFGNFKNPKLQREEAEADQDAEEPKAEAEI